MYYFICFICSVKLRFIFVYKSHGQNLQYSCLVYRQNLTAVISSIAICRTSECWFGVIYNCNCLCVVLEWTTLIDLAGVDFTLGGSGTYLLSIHPSR